MFWQSKYSPTALTFAISVGLLLVFLPQQAYPQNAQAGSSWQVTVITDSWDRETTYAYLLNQSMRPDIILRVQKESSQQGFKWYGFEIVTGDIFCEASGAPMEYKFDDKPPRWTTVKVWKHGFMPEYGNWADDLERFDRLRIRFTDDCAGFFDLDFDIRGALPTLN